MNSGSGFDEFLAFDLLFTLKLGNSTLCESRVRYYFSILKDINSYKLLNI